MTTRPKEKPVYVPFDRNRHAYTTRFVHELFDPNRWRLGGQAAEMFYTGPFYRGASRETLLALRQLVLHYVPHTFKSKTDSTGKPTWTCRICFFPAGDAPCNTEAIS